MKWTTEQNVKLVKEALGHFYKSEKYCYSPNW